MTTAQMKYFIELAGCLSFTEAAERLYISQPALSRHISTMEAELNVQLFIRYKNTVRLTPAGSALYNSLQKIYGEYERTVEVVQSVQAGVVGSLNLGILEEQLVPRQIKAVLDRFRTENPNVQLNLSKRSFADLIRGLQQRTLDLAITLEVSLDQEPDLDFLSFEQVPLCLVVPKGHRLCGEKSVCLSSLDADREDMKMILPSSSDCPHVLNYTLENFAALGFRPQYRCAPNAGLNALWVEAGLGITMFTRENAMIYNPSLSFIPIVDYPPASTAAVWNRQSADDPLVQLFLSRLRLAAGL